MFLCCRKGNRLSLLQTRYHLLVVNGMCQLFSTMIPNNLEEFTENEFLSLIHKCALNKNSVKARQLHLSLVCCGLDSVAFWADHLIRLFTSCDSLDEANQAFCRVQRPSLYTWNAIISAHVKLGNSDNVFALYGLTQQLQLVPDRVMVLSLLKSGFCHLQKVRLVHHQIYRHNLERDAIIGSALVDIYAKGGALQDAYKLFEKISNRDVVSWAVLITGCIHHEYYVHALELFEDMRVAGIRPDRVAYLCALKACSHVGDINLGRVLHSETIQDGFDTHLTIGNALIDIYGRCGSINEANRVLEKLQNRDNVSWSTLIASCVQNENDALAFLTFKRMQDESLKPSKVTYLCVLKSCINLAAKVQGQLVHAQIIESGFCSDLEVGNCLVDFYSKCGMLYEAHKAFVQLPRHDIVSWGALVSGYAQDESSEFVLKILEDMDAEGMKPNDIIFTSILAACSRSGRIEVAKMYFKVLVEKYNLKPSIEQYSCMIDLFGRTGCLEDAEQFFDTMPLIADAVSWKSLLNNCRTHGSVQLGRQCFEQVVEMEPDDATNYELLSSLYAQSHMWEDVDQVQAMRRSARAWKKPGKAWVEINQNVVEFIMGGKDNEQSDEIYDKFNKLGKAMRDEGYFPTLHNVT